MTLNHVRRPVRTGWCAHCYKVHPQGEHTPMPEIARPRYTPASYEIGMVHLCICGDPLYLTGELPGMTYWLHIRSGSVQCRMTPIPEEALTDWARDTLRGHDKAHIE